MATGTPIFVDTSAYLALLSERDVLHPRAVEVEGEIRASRRPLITTDWVLTEFLAATAPALTRVRSATAVNRLLGVRQLTIVPADRAWWNRGFALYTQRCDKDWSLVDCISFEVCREWGASEVFTHDQHFAQAGFRVLL